MKRWTKRNIVNMREEEEEREEERDDEKLKGMKSWFGRKDTLK